MRLFLKHPSTAIILLSPGIIPVISILRNWGIVDIQNVISIFLQKITVRHITPSKAEFHVFSSEDSLQVHRVHPSLIPIIFHQIKPVMFID